MIDDIFHRVLSSASASAASSKESIISLVVIASTQISTSCLSLVSSATMAAMIASTEKGLTTPYRRIIFGLSISDIFQSLAMLTGPFFVPRDVEDSWGIGDVGGGTCKINGSFLMVGLAAVPMYTCFLCLYYLCKLKYKMENDRFAIRMEWKIHTFIICTNIVLLIAALAMDTLHPAIFRNLCTTAVTPLGCRVYPELVGVCDPIVEKRVNGMVFFSHFVLYGICLVTMIGIMTMLSFHAIFLNKIMTPSRIEAPALNAHVHAQHGQSRSRLVTGTRANRGVEDIHNSVMSTLVTETMLEIEETTTEHNTTLISSSPNPYRIDDTDVHMPVESSISINTSDDSPDVEDIHDSMTEEDTPGTEEPAMTMTLSSPIGGHSDFDYNVANDEHEHSSPPQQPPQEEEESTQNRIQNQARHLSTLYKNETMLQACLYVGSFFLVYSPVILNYIFLIANLAPPMSLQFSVFALLPLGGFLNILVYTRPQAATLRRNYPSISRLHCLWLVLRAGGDLPVMPNLNNSNHPIAGDNFLDVPPPPRLLHESMSDVQIGVASARGGGLGSAVSSNFRSNLGMDGMSQSFGMSHPDYNPKDNWLYIQGGGHGGDVAAPTTSPGGSRQARDRTVSSAISTLRSPNTRHSAMNASSLMQSLESIQEHQREYDDIPAS